MKTTNILNILVFMLILTISCSDMNDLHDNYLKDGEIIYIGRIDSLKTFSGKDRALIKYWITDPRVEKLLIYWNQKQDSVIVPITPHSASDPLEVMIGDGSELIKEGDHTLFFFSYDNKNHRSIVYESIVSVFGSKYISTLTNRSVESTEINTEGDLLITWKESINSDEIGVVISYLDKNGNASERFIPNSNLSGPVVFENLDTSKPISYMSAFLPQESSIDTFYTEKNEYIKVTLIDNVALNKKTIVSDMLNSNYPGEAAVDGVISSNSRWVSPAAGEHWIEVDFGDKYPIQSFKTYNGNGNAPNIPIKNFMFQVYIDNDWNTILEVSNNTNHSYGAHFEEIITNKVRLFIPDYPDNQVRLFELEVYSQVTLN